MANINLQNSIKENSVYQTKDKGYGSFLVIKNDLVGDYINNNGLWEYWLMVFSRLFLSKNDVVIDAGANIGFHTVQFARLSKLVYAFEPQKNIFDLLSSNLVINGCNGNVLKFRYGLYDSEKEMNLDTIKMQTDIHTGQLNYGGIGFNKQKTGGENALLKSWDENFTEIDISMVKMDIQGSELYALRGMERMLIKCKPWLMIENGLGQDGKDVRDFLRNLGYTIYRPKETIPEGDCICLHFENQKHYPIIQFIQYITALPVPYKIDLE